MPRLWSGTIESHRRVVRDAVLDAAASLVAERGLRAVTMSEVAERTGIGRATLYKYFPDVDSIVVAWHERQIAKHLEQLVKARDAATGPQERLRAVLEAYALIDHEHHGTELARGRHGGERRHAHRINELRHGQHGPDLAALMHRGQHVARAEQQLRRLIRELVADGVGARAVRDDIAPDELVSYCLNALGAASGLPSRAAVRRLVAVTLAGLRPARREGRRPRSD